MSSTKYYFNPEQAPGSGRWGKRARSCALWGCTLGYLGTFIASLVMSQWQLAPLTSNPLLGAGRTVLLDLGVTATYKITADNEWWRLLSSPFICAGTLHVWATSSGLWTFGLFLSSALSPWQLILVFMLSLLASVTASANIAANFITSAASGPIFGLIGGTCVALILHRKLFNHHILSWCMLSLVLALNLYMGATPFVDNSCNVVGFAAGAMSTLGLLLLNRQGTDSKGRETMLRVGCCALLMATVAIPILGVVGLNLSTLPLQGCCDNLVCTPSPLWDCNASRVQMTCTFSQFPNGTMVMACPTGAGVTAIPSGMTNSAMLALCDSECSGAVSNSPDTSPGAAPGTTQGGGTPSPDVSSRR